MLRVMSFSREPRRPMRARVLAAVAGVDHDGGEARSLGFAGCCGRFCDLLDQHGDRIDRDQRVDVEHQPVAVFGDRRQVEDLRLHLGLEVQHQADHARAVARDAQALDVGIRRRDLAVQLGERGRELACLQVEHQALGILEVEDRVLDLSLDSSVRRV